MDLVDSVLRQPRLLGQPVVVLLDKAVEQLAAVESDEHSMRERGLGAHRRREPRRCRGGRLFAAAAAAWLVTPAGARRVVGDARRG